MKILLLGSFADSVIKFRGPLISDLRAGGHEVVVGVPSPGDLLRGELRELGAEMIETPLSRRGLSPAGDFAYYRKLLGIIKTEKPGFVLTYTIKPNIWGGLAAGRCGVPSAAMVTGLGSVFTGESTGLAGTMLRKAIAFLYRRSTAYNRVVIFQNPDDIADFIAAGCLNDASKARLVNGSGVDTAHYAVAPLPEKPVFLLIARLLVSKGVREYAEAATAVLKQVPDARCLLAGFHEEGKDGIGQHELERWISNGMEYLGPLEDVRPAIAAASVYVLPSYREGTPRSVLEAMSMGRPVITTDAPGCRETVIEGGNGFLVPVMETASLKQRMMMLADDEKLRAAMGKRSRQIVKKRYEVSKVNAALLQHLGMGGNRGKSSNET